MVSRASARFPLSLLNLAAALEPVGNSRILDGNIDRDVVAATLKAVQQGSFDAVGITVMGGPQVEPAVAVSKSIRERRAALPIIWGGYFPTLHSAAAMAAPYVDYAIRGQGHESFPELVQALSSGAAAATLTKIKGLSWRHGGEVIHNPGRPFSAGDPQLVLPYDKLGDPRRYLGPTFLGRRTAAHQAALGCRFRCTFCGVAAMFGGATVLPPAERLERELTYLKYTLGADSVLYLDHNFFDREADMIPMLEVMAKFQMPWWCYARSDALLKLSASSWKLVRQSQLRMAYIGAETPTGQLLKEMRKGTRPDQTLQVAELCARHGVIPEFSFMVAPPQDTEAETERTFEFIRVLKRINPQSEIVIYIYTPLPQYSRHEKDRGRRASAPLQDANGEPVHFPGTPEEWTRPQWVAYACHTDAPWLTDRMRRRIHDFVTVLGCRYPTVQDLRSPDWAKRSLSTLARWRYARSRYDRPWELNLAKKLVRLHKPQVSGA
jgi:anaerobic magnesium-protoporphyrin IX monomethyl ester cyclase